MAGPPGRCPGRRRLLRLCRRTPPHRRLPGWPAPQASPRPARPRASHRQWHRPRQRAARVPALPRWCTHGNLGGTIARRAALVHARGAVFPGAPVGFAAGDIRLGIGRVLLAAGAAGPGGFASAAGDFCLGIGGAIRFFASCTQHGAVSAGMQGVTPAAACRRTLLIERKNFRRATSTIGDASRRCGSFGDTIGVREEAKDDGTGELTAPRACGDCSCGDRGDRGGCNRGAAWPPAGEAICPSSQSFWLAMSATARRISSTIALRSSMLIVALQRQR